MFHVCVGFLFFLFLSNFICLRLKARRTSPTYIDSRLIPLPRNERPTNRVKKHRGRYFVEKRPQEPGDIPYVLKKRVEATNEETDTRSIEKRVGKKNNKYGRNGGTNKISVTWTHMDTLGHPAVTKVNKKSRKKRRDRYAAIYALFFVCSNHSLAHPGPVLHYNAARPRWICVPFIG